MGARREAVNMLVLLGLVAVDLFPFSPTLVPLQLVLRDGCSVVGWGVPAKGEVVFRPIAHLGRVGLRWTEGRDCQRTLCTKVMKPNSDNKVDMAARIFECFL